MTSPAEIERILGSEISPPRRILFLGALLAQETESEVIVVGGSAIEVYTEGGYASGDIDLVAPRVRIQTALKKWGFKETGRIWIHRRLGLAVDTVGDHYSGDISRTREIVTPYGRVRVAAMEDLILRRLAAIKHWRRKDELKEVNLLLAGYADVVDWDYLSTRAGAEDVLDLLNDLRGRLPVSRA